MKYLLLAGAAVLGYGVWRLWRDWLEAERFAAWRVDHDRRTWGEGDVNQPCITFPIQKLQNETAWRQTRKLKRRA